MVKIIENKAHPKIKEAIIMFNNDFIAEGVSEFEFYMYFLNHVSFFEAQMPMGTMAATIYNNRLAILWDNEFVDSLSLSECQFVLIHEAMHLLSHHLERGKNYNREVSNIAMDMIINHLIIKYHGKYVQIPRVTQAHIDRIINQAKEKGVEIEPEKLAKLRKSVGETYCVEMDPNYKGDLVFEPLYNWLQEQWLKEKEGKPNELSEKTKEMMKQAEQMQGMTLDYHGELTDIEEEIKRALGREAMEKSKYEVKRSRGTVGGGIEEMLELLLKTPKRNNMKLIKQMISSMKGRAKQRTYRRLSKRVPGMKGNIKQALEVNVILDTSGSMSGEFEAALTQIYQGGYCINLVQADTQVNKVEKITDHKKFNKLKIAGLGGTIIQPAVEYVMDPKNKLSRYGTIILSDGYTDTLDFKGTMGSWLLITTQTPIPYVNGPNVRSISIEKQ